MKTLYVLLIMAPVAIFLEYFGGGSPVLVFVTSGLAMVPLAGLLGQATESVAAFTGPKIGALLNATLGNAAELIITIVALQQGLVNVVKASIAGSIIGNILIVLGASMLMGGLKNGTQRYDQHTAGTNATMMILAVVALAVPSFFSLSSEEHRPTIASINLMSDWLAIVLIVLYALYLFYILRSAPGEKTAPEATREEQAPTLSLPLAIGVLAASTVGIVVMSEILVGALEPTAEAWGLSEAFIGVMLLPFIGNVAEHLVAVQAAVRNKMDLSLGIAFGSGLQIALFVAPLLVLIGLVTGHPISLVFNPNELGALVAAGLLAVAVSRDGESNWLEGAQLIAVYLMIGIAFFFVP